MAGWSGQGMFRRSVAQGPVGNGAAWQARRGKVRFDLARQDRAGRGRHGLGKASSGMPRSAEVWRGRRGGVWRGGERRGSN
jgi:hypothetical protein